MKNSQVRAAYVESMARNTNMLRNSKATTNGDGLNVPLYMALASFAAGGLPAWVEALPWCGEATPSAPAIEERQADEEADTSTTVPGRVALIRFDPTEAVRAKTERMLRCC